MTLSIGDTAPDFTMPSTDSESFNLYSELEKGPILLNFYVGDFGINCTNYMGKFIESKDGFDALGVRLVGINPDSLDSHRMWKDRIGSPFEYIHDEKQEVSKVYDAIVKESAIVKGFTNREFFLIDRDRKIKYIWRAPEPKVLPDVQEVLEGVRQGLQL